LIVVTKVQFNLPHSANIIASKSCLNLLQMPQLLLRGIKRLLFDLLIKSLVLSGVYFAFPLASQAITQVRVGIAVINGAHWRLHNLHLSLAGLQSQTNTLELQADRLELPKPFDRLHLVNVHCTDFELQKQQLQCRNGNVTLKLEGLPLKPFKCRFLITAAQSSLEIADLKLAKGVLALKAMEQAGQWQLALEANGIGLAELQPLLNQPSLSLKNGTVSAQLKLEGKQVALGSAAFKMQLNDATLQGSDGRYALEGAKLDAYLNAQPLGGAWGWQSHLVFKEGALYADPVYLKAPARAIELDSVGQWLPTQQQVQLDYVQYLHPQVATLNGSATLALNGPPQVKTAQLNLSAQDLKPLTTIYNAPFWVGSAFEGVTLTGQLQAKLTLAEQALTALQLDFEHLALLDPKQRFGLKEAKGLINWAKQADFNQPAELQWQQLQIYALPLGKAKLNLGVKANAVELSKPVQIDFLGGNFEVDQFTWQARPQQTPELHFSGALQKVSLAQLTQALDWTPLTGTISGAIPGINYHNNRLDLDGVLTVQMFDGKVTITKLAVANLLSAVPKFYGDINIERLDLKQLTGKFKFGSIDGLLSGFVRDLYLENWHPVSFYAWLGTPEDDDTKHRISQKAVDNIANIGGNGATDLISRSVLGVFDSFGYDQLGLGCYLNAGVCQLMGVAPAKNGYYIVKGGGLPRIDVIGYNPRVDWTVLMQRLARIGKQNDMVVE
jgi:hypothetical protein